MMKCFKIKSYNINNRLDPLFYSNDILAIFSKSNFPKRYLCDIVKYFKTGFAAGKAEQSENQNDIIQIRPTNINENRQLIFQKNIYISRKTLPEKKQYLVQKREILFNNTNSQELVGKSVYFYLVGDFFCSNHITRMGVDEKIVNPIYLTYILNWMQENKVFYNTCTNWNNQSGINIELLKSYIVPLPSLNVQNEIVKIIQKAYTLKSQYEDEANDLLSAIDNIILKRLDIERPNVVDSKTYIIKSNDVKNGRMDAFGYQPTPRAILKSIHNSKFSNTIVSLKNLIIENFSGEWGKDYEKDIPDEFSLCKVLRNKNFNNLYNIDFDEIAYRIIPNTKKNKILLKKGDILIEKSGGSPQQPVGRVAYIANDEENLTFSNFLQCMRINQSICSPEFLFIYLRIIYRLNYMKYIQSQTTGIINLLMDDFFNIPVILLNDIREQEQLVIDYNNILNKAKKLQNDAKYEFKQAKIKIEKIILGEL